MTDLRSFYKNSSIVAVGEGVAALASIGALAIAARVLGTENFGRLAMIMAFAMILDLVFNLQSSRVAVRYGASPLEAGQPHELSVVLKVCLILDVCGAGAGWLLGSLVAVLLVPEVLDVPAPALHIYLLTVLTNISGYAYGLLRLAGRFGLLAAHRVFGAVARLTGVAVLVGVGRDDLTEVVMAIVATEIVSRLVLLGLFVKEAGRLGIERVMSVPFSRIRHAYPDIVSFAGLANLGDSALKVSQQLDVFIVAALMTPAEAGLFRAIKSLGSVPKLASAAVSQVLYPSLAREHADDEGALWRAVRPLWIPLSAVSLAGVMGYALVGGWLVPLVFGEEFSAAVVPSVVYMVGAALGIVLVPITPVSLVSGQQRQLFVSYLGAAIANLVAVSVGGFYAGLVGASSGLLSLYGAYGVISALYWRVGRR